MAEAATKAATEGGEPEVLVSDLPDPPSEPYRDVVAALTEAALDEGMAGGTEATSRSIDVSWSHNRRRRRTHYTRAQHVTEA
jgi:hypothetical protein